MPRTGEKYSTILMHCRTSNARSEDTSKPHTAWHPFKQSNLLALMASPCY